MPAELYALPAIYEAFMGGEPSETQLAFYDALIAGAGEPVLELACGTGRFAVPLARRGHEVTGLDRSRPMLDHARAKAGSGLPVTWVEGDMRSFDLGRRFGFICAPGQSFQHLVTRDDVERALERIRRHLRPGGALLLQLFTPSPAILARVLEKGSLVTTNEWHPLPGSSHRLRATIRASYDQARQVLSSVYDYTSEDGSIAGSFELSMRQFFPQEIDALLHYGGFDVVAKYGDHQLTPFERRPGYQHIVCRPRG